MEYKNIHLKQGALLNKVRAITKNGNSSWGAKEQDALSADMIDNLKDESGNAPDLKNVAPVIKALLSPTEKNLSEGLRVALENAGYQLDKATEATLGLLLNPVGFADYLAKTADPMTGKPFIKKPTKGVKKKAFDALLAESSVVAEIPGVTEIDSAGKASS